MSDTVITCAWKQDERDGYWEAECGMTWEFTTGDPFANRFAFCPNCGKRVHTVIWQSIGITPKGWVPTAVLNIQPKEV